MSTATVFDVTSNPGAQEFERIFREHYPMVYRTAYSLLGNAADAEDILQTIFLRLLRREVQPDSLRNIRGYFYRAAVNLSLDAIRERRRFELTADVERFEAPVDSSETHFKENTHRQLAAAFAELNPEAAQILVLRYVHDYSDADIAKLRGEQNVREFLARSFAPFREMPPEQMESAGERVLRNLQEQPEWEAGFAAEPSPSLRHFRRWPRLAVAAAAVVAITVAVTVVVTSTWRSAPLAVIEVTDGGLQRTSGVKSEIIQVGASLGTGEIVRSGDVQGAVIVMKDGSRIEMRSQSELSLERAEDGIRIRLNKGGVIVSAAKQRTGHLYVQTKDVTVSVVGTVFFVNAEAAGSRVGVVEGEVHVQQVQQGAMQKLFPGQQIVTAASMASVPVAEEIAWSRSAPAHMAQLQRSTAIEPGTLQFDAGSVRPDPQPTGGGASVGPLVCRGIDGGDRVAVPPNTVFPSSAPLGRCVGRYVNLASLIAAAYDVPQRNVSGGPEWAATAFGSLATFQIEAKAERPESTTRAQLRQMLQSMLADRFQLKVRRETKQSPGFAMVIAMGGLKVKEAMGDEEPLEIHTGNGGGARGQAPSPIQRVVVSGKTSMAEFAAFFSRCPQMGGRLVADKTGLAGIYDFNLALNWIPGPPPVEGVPITRTCTAVYDPPISWAVEEQLGLHREPGLIVPEEFIVIDHVEKPPEN